MIINNLGALLKIKATCGLKSKVRSIRSIGANHHHVRHPPTIFPQVIHIHFNEKYLDFMRRVSMHSLSKNEALMTLNIGYNFPFKTKTSSGIKDLTNGQWITFKTQHARRLQDRGGQGP